MPSTVIAAISYDPTALTLTVTYVSGVEYRYKNVPEKIFKELKASSSKGRYLNFQIKSRYDFERI